MTAPLEDALRGVVQDLAGEAVVGRGFAEAAIRKGRRIRRRRRVTTAVAMFALIGVAVTPYALLRDRRLDRAAPPEPMSTFAYDTQWWGKPLTLPGGLVVTGVRATRRPRR
jgi:hypothetical protein